MPVVGVVSEARALFRRGRFDESAERLRQALDVAPGDTSLLTALGAVLHKLGHFADARTALEQAIAFDPGCAAAWDNLGVVLRDLGRTDEALTHHRRALELDRGFARARANYGLALLQVGETEAAEANFREALALDHGIASAHCALGGIHQARDELEEAESAYRLALALEPGRVRSLSGLATVLLATGRYVEALRLQRRAVRLAPGDTWQYILLGNVLSSASRDHEALAIYRMLERRGVSGSPLWFGKAAALANLGRHESAIRLYRKALAAEPRSPRRSGYFFALHASARASRRWVLRELRQWERYNGAPPERRYHAHERDPDPERKLRIGYISPDFRLHVVRQFFEPVLLVHDSERFEFYCYAELRRSDFATRELRAVADRWYHTHRVSDEEVAAQIDRDRIDILVDLAGHTANHRLGVMTLRPAPVQATYLGYFGSTGLTTIDYWITDEVLHPPDTDEPATETIHRLPRCGFCYGVPTHAPDRMRRAVDVPAVFGCFNNVSKVGLPVVDAWAAILRRCPGSRLVLKDRRFAFGPVRRAWRQRFERRGIDTARVALLPGSPHAEYLQAYNSIDIALDPFPRTGGTTTCDALWMGAPVVTLAGRRYVERLSAAKLAAVGVSELITHSVDEYIEKAVYLATDVGARRDYHETLRARMARSPLCDPVSLARALEDTYRAFWRRYVANPRRQ